MSTKFTNNMMLTNIAITNVFVFFIDPRIQVELIYDAEYSDYRWPKMATRKQKNEPL